MKTEIELLPAIPGHTHMIGEDGNPSCGCRWPDDMFQRVAELQTHSDPPVIPDQGRQQEGDEGEFCVCSCVHTRREINRLRKELATSARGSRPLNAPECPACEGKGWISPDDAERQLQANGEVHTAGYELGKKVGAERRPATETEAQLRHALELARPTLVASADASHMLDGFDIGEDGLPCRKPNRAVTDADCVLQTVDAALALTRLTGIYRGNGLR